MNRLLKFLDSRLQQPYLAAVSGAIVAVNLALAVAMFATADRGRTAFGIPLGADFAGFYVAAEILNRGETEQLYDRTLHHRLYHELLPDEQQQEVIPYVHPPFVAGLFRPLAYLPYPVAVAIWLVISLTLYVTIFSLTLKTLPWRDRNQWLLLILLAVSFEPFAFECWLGGQLSAIAFFSFGLCLILMQSNRDVLAGMALGISFYKPTILLLVLPMLLIGRQGRLLLGMTITGLVLVTLSLLLVGWSVNVGYLNVLLSFQKSTSGGDLEIRTWKYVDVNNCLRLLLGSGSNLHRPLLVGLAAVPIVLLGYIWWRADQRDREIRNPTWAATITWIPILNLYFGIYDSILIVYSVLITAASIVRNSHVAHPLIRSRFAYLLLMIYLAPWFSQNVAQFTGISSYTLLLGLFGSVQLCRILFSRPHSP